jgi:putative oxidoreductase
MATALRSALDRFAFGRPVIDSTPAPIRIAARPSTALVARVLIAGIFILSGVMKLVHPEGATGYLASKGVGAAGTLILIAGVAEVLGGLAVALGVLTRVGALGLILYLIPTTLIFHAFWAVPTAEQATQMANFMKNLSIMGGLLLLVADGPGRYSLDCRLRGPARRD